MAGRRQQSIPRVIGYAVNTKTISLPDQVAPASAPTAKQTVGITRDVGWGIVGPGKIAHRFADAVARMPGARLAAVQGRDLARASAFASVWARPDPPNVYTALDALLRDPAVDAVYIATPHAFHADAVRLALDAG